MDNQAIPAESEPEDPRIDAALREYLERVDRGEPVDREEFLARHPDVAEELRSFLTGDEDVRRMLDGGSPVDPAANSTKSFAQRGQETVAPHSREKRNLAADKSGLQGQFGRYRILRTLGSGAMGTVYLAEDTQLERQVAIKRPNFDDDPTGELLTRFYREARAAATLRHNNICTVFDVGEIDGKHYISMEYIDGVPMASVIRTGKPQSERQALIAIHKLALALAEAHARNIVHRDLKPANIMVNRKGEPIIMDFGLARQVHQEDQSRLTQSGMLVGTPAYMSPEQIDAEQGEVGPASDQYALGVILYELLTGQLPYRGTIMNVMAQILTKELTPPSQLRPDLDPRIEAICLKMMSKKPADRLASLAVVAEKLAKILKNPGAKQSVSTPLIKLPAGSEDTAGNAKTSAVRSSLSPKAKTITASDLVSLEELAQKCLRRRDYDQIIQILERIPEEKRSPTAQALLQKAREKSDEIAYLIVEIDEADRLEDGQAALKKAEELLKIKPGHHRARAIQEKYSGYGTGGAARIGPVSQLTQYWSEGGWIPWSVLAFGLAVFVVMCGVMVIYLGKTAIVIDVQDPDIKVEVTAQGKAITITGPKEEKVYVEPGEQQLKITYAGLETLTKSFELKKGDKKTITVSIVDKELVARLENEILPLPSGSDNGSQKKEPAKAGASGSPENKRSSKRSAASP